MWLISRIFDEYFNIMAKPIKITPVLEGSEAINFLKTIKNNSSKAVSKAKILAIHNDASILQSLAKK